jgi:two-component system, cell cycle sensor histidine kinase and response regulator CckA
MMVRLTTLPASGGQMKKKACFTSLLVILSVICIGSSIEGQVTSTTAKRKTLIAVIPTDSPPTYFKDIKTNEAAGFAVEVMNAIGKQTGYSISYQFKSDWTEIIDAVKKGTADIAPEMGITEDRKKVLSFTLPTDTFPVSVFVRADSGITELRSGMKVGVLKGSAAYEKIKGQSGKVLLESYESFQDGLLDLLAGQIDAFCCPAPTLLKLATNADLEDRIKIVGPPLMELKRAIAVRQDNKELLAELNKAVDDFVNTPEYQQIYAKWYGKPRPYWTVERIGIFAAGFAVLIIVIMALWRHYSIVSLNKNLTKTIVEKNKAEDGLKKSEENFRNFFNKSADAIFLVRPDGSIADVNDVVCTRYNYSREELLTMNVEQIDSPGMRNDASKRTERVLKGGIVTFEVEHITKDGKIIPTEANASSVMMGNEPFLISTCRDITERKKAEEALAAEKERLTVTLRSIGDAVIVTDIHGSITLINKVGEQLTGWSNDEATGKPLFDVFHILNATTREKCENPVEMVLKTGFIVGLANHTILITRDGKELIIDDSAAPIRDKQSETIGIVLVFRDITAQYQMEQEMQKMEKLESLGILAGGLAHDFNNLLTAIMGNVSLVKMQLGAEHKSFARLTDVEKAARRATDLTQQLLTFAKGGAPIKKPASISEIAKEACLFALAGSQVKCLYTIPASLWSAEVDKGQMNQVFNNLIINSIHAMPAGGTVHINFENVAINEKEVASLKAGDYVKITFRDEGSGIPEDKLAKIFEPYYTTKADGSGLGLATVSSIIKRHEGHVTAESALGVGTTFTIFIPALKDTISPVSEEVKGAQTGHGRVLIMDDEAIIRKVAGDILNELGYEAAFACDGKDAIEVYLRAEKEKKPFDVVIMDLTIPGAMGGKEAVKKLQSICHHAKVIVSSGYSMDPIMAEYEKHGFCGVVCKPYNAREISEVISKVLKAK